MTDRLYGLATGQPDALALLRLAHADADEQWTTPQLRVEIATRQLARLVDVDAHPDLYTPLRTAIERWVEEDAGWPSDLTPDQADGEVLWALYVLLHGSNPCRACFRQASRLDMLQPDGKCCDHVNLRVVA